MLMARNIRDKNITPGGIPGTINNIILGVMLYRLKYIVKLLRYIIKFSSNPGC
jgi:hypothetical protein